MPRAQEELQASKEGPFFTMWFVTKLGTRYELPDMLPLHIGEAHRQLAGGSEHISVINVSQVAVVFPLRILAKAGVADRTLWEVE